MSSGFKGQPSTTQLKSSTSSVSSIRSSLSSSTSTSQKMKTYKNSSDATTENALIKEIYEQFLNCKLCSKPFLRPKTLNCLHTFCEDCLAKYKDTELEGCRYISYSMRSKLSCPTCTKKTDLPPGGVKRLQDSFLLSSLNQVVARVSRSSKSSFGHDGDIEREEKSSKPGKKVWCGICSKGSSEDQMTASSVSVSSNTAENPSFSSKYSTKSQKSKTDVITGQDDNSCEEIETRKEATVECLDCSAKLLCRDCALMHMNTEVTQNHSLVDIDLARQGRLQCSEHTQEIVRFYCDSCETCVCILCTFNDHKTHRIVTFSESVKCQIQVLENRFKKCKKTYDIMKGQLDAISNFEATVAIAESIIKERSEELTRLIKKEEEKSLNELKSVIQSEDVSSFLEQKPYFEQMLLEIERTLNSTELLLENKNVEVILTKKKMDTEMKRVLEWTSRNVPDRLLASLTFECHPINLCLGVLKTEQSLNRRSSSSEGRSSENSSSVVESNTLSTSDKDSCNGEIESSPVIDSRPDINSREIVGGDNEDEKSIIIHQGVNDETCVCKTPTNQPSYAKESFAIKSDAFTITDLITSEDKSTLTNLSQIVNKAVSTKTLSTSEKSVSTVSSHVSSVYKDLVEAKITKSVMVSRGTMTLSTCDIFPSKQDRASSPVKALYLDKSTMANKAELSEPKDVFCRPGLEGKPKKIIECIPANARLDSINEGSDEDKSGGEETKPDLKFVSQKLQKIGSPKFGSRFASAKPLPNFANQRSITPNSAIVYPLASRRSGTTLGEKFRSNGTKHLASSKRFSDVGTNTEIVTYLEKSVATETSRDQTIVGCINILKTVRDRMESIPSPGSMSLENSDANLILSKISEPSSSMASSFEIDKNNGCFSKLNDSTECYLSAKSVDAGGGLASNTPDDGYPKKLKSYQPHSQVFKRQRTPGPAQSVDGSNSSGKSSTNNSPGLQRSGKMTRTLENPQCFKSPKLARAKMKSIPDPDPRQNQVKSKFSPGLTDLSDSLHSESSEEYDRCGSGESFAGITGCGNLENDRSFAASIKQRLVCSPISGRKQKTELTKVLNPTNKSPRPQRKF